MLLTRLLQLVFLVCVCRGPVSIHGASNIVIDLREPIVRVSPALINGGDSLDLFGYSVVLHQVAEPTPGNFESAINNTR